MTKYLYETLILLLLLTSTTLIFADTPLSGVIALIALFVTASIILVWNMLEFFAFVILAIYVGAIAIFFLFIIMTLNLTAISPSTPFVGHDLLFISIIFVFGAGLIYWPGFLELLVYQFQNPIYLEKCPEMYGVEITDSVDVLGAALYRYWGFYIIIAGIILFVAMIGALTILSNNVLREKNSGTTHAKTY
jgi:NADH-quinone oxidoreductase subunit J